MYDRIKCNCILFLKNKTLCGSRDLYQMKLFKIKTRKYFMEINIYGDNSNKVNTAKTNKQINKQQTYN